MEAGVNSAQEGQAATSVHDLHDAGKVVVEAAGTVAADRLRTEVDARSSRAAVEIKSIAVAMRASSAVLFREQGQEGQAAFIDGIAGRASIDSPHGWRRPTPTISWTTPSVSRQKRPHTLAGSRCS